MLHYDPVSGQFHWLMRPSLSGTPKAGSLAGYDNGSGYIKIGFEGKRYYAHRLAFLYMNGVWPKEIDHINGIRTDNRWVNLREVTRSINQQNRHYPKKTNPTHLLGVARIVGNKFRARIFFKGKQYHLGVYETPQLARIAYLKAKRIFHKESDPCVS